MAGPAADNENHTRKGRWRWAPLALPLLVFAPHPPSSVAYKSVAATERFGVLGSGDEKLLFEDEVDGRREKLFAIHHGRLFLRFQRTWPSSLLVTWVDFDSWTENRVAELRRDHPELEAYWPEPGRKDGGLRWVAEEK